MEIVIVPILAFLCFACLVFSLASLMSANRLKPDAPQARTMEDAQRQDQRRAALKKSGILFLVALAALILLAILTFSVPS